ncbi:MAG: hypothetical protein U0936_11270 [Planctomycetaceae bacterium]
MSIIDGRISIEETASLLREAENTGVVADIVGGTRQPPVPVTKNHVSTRCPTGHG